MWSSEIFHDLRTAQDRPRSRSVQLVSCCPQERTRGPAGSGLRNQLGLDQRTSWVWARGAEEVQTQHRHVCLTVLLFWVCVCEYMWDVCSPTPPLPLPVFMLSSFLFSCFLHAEEHSGSTRSFCLQHQNLLVILIGTLYSARLGKQVHCGIVLKGKIGPVLLRLVLKRAEERQKKEKPRLTLKLSARLTVSALTAPSDVTGVMITQENKSDNCHLSWLRICRVQLTCV